MAKNEKCTLTNMCMVYDGNRVLVQNRRDVDWGGITFPGGHVELCESFVDSVVREVYEETGLTVSNVKLCGIKQWVQPDGSSRYIVLFFKTNTFSGELRSSAEGEVFWIDREDIFNYKLAEGFDKMLEVFLNDDFSENFAWYENEIWNVKNL